eukprot:4165978-Pleurochrysis_carterae.AAC.1
MSAVYIALPSLHYSQRVPHLSDNTLKRLAVALTRKVKVGRIGSTGGKRAVGLLEDLRLYVNQRRSYPELKDLSAAEAEHRLLLRCDSVSFSETILEARIEPSLAVASAESYPTTSSGVSPVQQLGGSSSPIGGKDTLPRYGGSRRQPPITPDTPRV